MTDETKRKRDELAKEYRVHFRSSHSFSEKHMAELGFSDGFDAGYAEGQAEIAKWKRKYIEARKSGYAEGLTNAIRIIECYEKALKKYSHEKHHGFSAREALAEAEAIKGGE